MAWFLESIASDGSRVTQPIRNLPFRIGRDAANHLAVDARGLSRQHALIELDAAGRLQVTDLDSTNGTFVNRVRVQGARILLENDVIHFGNAEYRLGTDTGSSLGGSPEDSERTMIVPAGAKLSERFVRHERQFMELLNGQGLSGAVQPIVEARTGKLFAYELLGRSTHPELPASPIQLFHLAAVLDREAELSAAFRHWGIKAIAPRLNGARLFVNTHPNETFTEGLFEELSALRALPDPPNIVIEVHETAVMEVERMKELSVRLRTIGVAFAYDDFGAGQSRLNELSDVPPDFVKFDMGLVHGIHMAGEGKQRMVRDLVRLVLDLGSVPLAEGIEEEAEAKVCRDMGFQLIQGYLTGKPASLSAA